MSRALLSSLAGSGSDFHRQGEGALFAWLHRTHADDLASDFIAPVVANR
jgi:hypothetical protein